MTRAELIAKRDRLTKELNATVKEIEELDRRIKKGKIAKICTLMKELWNENVCEVMELSNDYGDSIDIDFEDLALAIEDYFKI